MDTENTQLAAREAAVANAVTAEERVMALNALATEQWTSGLTVSLETAHQAHQLACDSGSVHELIRSLNTLGFLCYRQSQSPQARIWLTQALTLLQDHPDSSLEAECRHYLGMVYYGAVEMEASIEQLLLAQTLFEETANLEGRGNVFNDLGNLYYRMEDMTHALSAYRESMAQRQANGDRRGIACSLNNIAIIYNEIKETEQAIDSYEQCLIVARETSYKGLEMICLCNLAEVYAKQSRWDDAFAVCQAALELAHSTRRRDREQEVLARWARTHQAAGQFALAVPLYHQALVITRETADQRTECEVLASLGECLLAQGQLTDAHEALTQAAEIAEALEIRSEMFRISLGLSEASKRRGDFAQALEFYQKYHTVQQEVLSARNADRTKALMIQMQVEQVRKDAEIQRLRNVELAQANAALEDANRTLQTQAELLEAQAEELQAQAGELARQAAEDGLTGLANRRHLEGWLARQFYQARQENSPLTVALADVDHFKQVNDRFGHQIGDEVLMTVAQLFRQNCRAADLAARYGGEEFVLALPDTDACQAFALCERLRTAIESHDWSAIHPDLVVTLSMGLSDDLSVGSHERLLGLADARLYEAKHAGRNCVFPAVPANALIRDMLTRIPA